MLTIKEVIKTLYNALLQRLKKHRGNWEQNDPTADDYIKNRPFYTDETNKETVVKTTNFTATSSYWWGSPFAFIPVVGETYRVIFDGKEYICAGKIADWGGKYIGNASIDWDGPDTGEPFFYFWYDNYDYGMCVRDSGKHTITIEKLEVVKIDQRYLPENNNAEVEAAIDDLYSYANYLDNEVWNRVSYTQSQNLSASQKQTARTNIGAVSSDEITGVIKYNTAQSLTEAQKQQARTNIGAVEAVEGKMLTTNDYTTKEKNKLNSITTVEPLGDNENIVLIPKSVTPLIVPSYYSSKMVAFDFGISFVESDTFQQAVQQGLPITITIEGSSSTYNFNRDYCTKFYSFEGFGATVSSGGNINGNWSIFFTNTGLMLWEPYNHKFVEAFTKGQMISISMPNHIKTEKISTCYQPNYNQLAYNETIKVMALITTNTYSSGNSAVSIKEGLDATSSYDNGAYYASFSGNYRGYWDTSTPEKLMIGDQVYFAYIGYGSNQKRAYAYGNLSLINSTWLENEGLSFNEDLINTGEDFCLIKIFYYFNTEKRSSFALFSKEEGYTIPEVYQIVYHTKQLDEKFIPSTIARTEYVDTKISDLVNTAPEALDTLKELSTALGDDPNFATTILNQLNNKVEKVEGKGLSTNDYTNEEKTKVSLAATMYIDNIEPADAAIGSFWYDTTEE